MPSWSKSAAASCALDPGFGATTPSSLSRSFRSWAETVWRKCKQQKRTKLLLPRRDTPASAPDSGTRTWFVTGTTGRSMSGLGTNARDFPRGASCRNVAKFAVAPQT
eukprot:3007106-Lingulodinium_polyedra.AAC.1